MVLLTARPFPKSPERLAQNHAAEKCCGRHGDTTDQRHRKLGHRGCCPRKLSNQDSPAQRGIEEFRISCLLRTGGPQRARTRHPASQRAEAALLRGQQAGPASGRSWCRKGSARLGRSEWSRRAADCRERNGTVWRRVADRMASLARIAKVGRLSPLTRKT